MIFIDTLIILWYPRGRMYSHLGIVADMHGRGEGVVDRFLMKLYVAGQTPRAARAIANLRWICEEELNGQYEIVVIDVLERPQLAEDANILITPALIKELPPPLRRVVGDLSDVEKVLLGLELQRCTVR